VFVAGLALGLAALEILGNADPPPGVADLGVPVEALLVPAATGIASVVGIHVVPVGLLLVPALVAVGSLVASSIAIERRILARPSGPTAADRTALLGLVMLVASWPSPIAAAIPGAPVEPLPTGIETPVAGLPLDGWPCLPRSTASWPGSWATDWPLSRVPRFAARSGPPCRTQR
jgi:hypothetical protein